MIQYSHMQNEGDISIVRQFLHNRWVKAAIIIDIFAIITVIGIIIWNATKNTIIIFNITPIDAKIQIDGQGEYTNGMYQIHPGNHTITISHDGLETKSFDLELKAGYETTLTAFLKGKNGDFNFYTLRENYDSNQKLQQIASEGNNLTTDGDASAYSFIADYQLDYDIWQNNLPITYSTHDEFGRLLIDVTIRAKYDCEKTMCIEVLMVRTDDESLIKSLLMSHDLDSEVYEIKYKIY